jgi:hypothetical protein
MTIKDYAKRIEQLKSELANETRKSARKELQVTIDTLIARMDRLSKRA